jgi:hypothetical protein
VELDQDEQDTARQASVEEDKRIARAESLVCKFVDLLSEVVRRDCVLLSLKRLVIKYIIGIS